MNRGVNIPVRVIQPAEYRAEGASATRHVPQPRRDGPEIGVGAMTESGDGISPPEEVTIEDSEPRTDATEEAKQWKDRALRLQAEMDNYRKRQQKSADERIRGERERLLGEFLAVVDDLERALEAPAEDGASLRHGVAITHRSARQLLAREGVDQIEAENEAFDPAWHEAVATTHSNGTGAVPGTVVLVMEAGYRLGDRLLRPAKVVVAV